MYVSNEDDSEVTAIDIAAKKAVDKIKVGVEPEGITVSPDNRWVVSASETTNMLHWIDSKTRQIVENSLVDPIPEQSVLLPIVKNSGLVRKWPAASWFWMQSVSRLLTPSDWQRRNKYRLNAGGWRFG